jgi:hypothetical protein
MDSQGERKGTQGIGEGIERIRLPSWHEMLMDFIQETVEKGNEERDENGMKNGR